MYKDIHMSSNPRLAVQNKRIIGLDWLRGLCALSIMLYHFGGGSRFILLNKLSVYGVSIFFILSGLSMAVVYHNFIKDIRTSLVFFIKRLFRIIPLYLIVCLLYLIPNLYLTGSFDWYKFLINITTLFSFIDINNYIAIGAWSIGNEMVYYLFTPLIIFIFNTKKIVGNFVYFIILIVGMYFAFIKLNSHISLSEQWITYINPFNNFFLFTTGIFMYYNFQEVKITHKLILPLLVTFGVVFALIPFENQILITTNWERIVYCTLSAIIVFLFYKIEIKRVSYWGFLLEKLGIATYGIYLLHPIVRKYVCYFTDSSLVIIPSSIVITIFIALVSYYYYEVKIMDYGKILTKKITN